MTHGDPSQPGSVVVHVGVHKTGSSSIQETLFAARHALADLAYVTDGSVANPSRVVQNAFVPEVRADAVRQFRDMCAAAESAGRAILSAEAIAHFDASALADLHRALTAHWSGISYVGYIREPVSQVRSAFQHRLKNKVRRDFAFAEGKNLRRDYHLVVDRLDALVGRESVAVFPFERDRFPGGDVVRHFLDVVGVAADDVPLRRVNESLSATAVKALYCYRRLRVADDAEIGHDASRLAFHTALAGIGGPAFVLDPAIEERIAAANAHIFEWSEQRMGRRLSPAQPSPDGVGVRDEADLMRFADDELAELARWAEDRGLRARATRSGADGVADLLADVRLRLAATRES